MGKTSIQLRAAMRIDLKDSGSLWSDAELNRMIERAVADLSRYLPEDRVDETTLVYDVDDEALTFPVDTDADRIVDGADISATTDGDMLTITAQPDVPRPLTMTVTDTNGSITNMSVTIRGTDRNGLAITENLHYANGQGVITGKEYFKTVNQVEVDQIDGNGAADVLDIGVGAYTDVWRFLENSPIRNGSDSGTDAASNTLARGTDYYIDYSRGAVKAISGGEIAAAEACTFTYQKSEIGVSLKDFPRLIRVQRVEYPVGRVPQNFVTENVWGKRLFITGSGEDGDQLTLREGEHVRVYYDAEHLPPNDWAPGTVPDFLEDSITMAAEAYALLVYALKQEHQAETDIASMRTSLGAANTAHTALGTALTNIKKYLDNNSASDAVGILATIATLHTAIGTALDAANTQLDLAPSSMTDGEADFLTLRAYIDAVAAPSAKLYLTDGDAFLNTVNVGAEQTGVPDAHRGYAQAVYDIFGRMAVDSVTAYINIAARRIDTALGYAQEAQQRLVQISSKSEQAAQYTSVATTFAREAEARLQEVAMYLQQASGYGEAASGELILADRYRQNALDMRNEVLSIWRDRHLYIGDFTMGSVRQMPTYNRNLGS